MRGLAYFLALLLKPTNLIFLPWIFIRKSGRLAVALWGGGWGALVSIAFIFSFGWERLFSLHQQWLSFLPHSMEKHLYRVDNYGLPSWLASHDFPSLHPWLLIVSVLLAFIVSSRSSWQGSLAFCGYLICLASPMTWLQNFTLLLPLAIYSMGQFNHRRNPVETLLWGGGLVIFYASFQIYNPTTCALGLCDYPSELPFYGFLVSGVCFGMGALLVRVQRKQAVKLQLESV